MDGAASPAASSGVEASPETTSDGSSGVASPVVSSSGATSSVVSSDGHGGGQGSFRWNFPTGPQVALSVLRQTNKALYKSLLKPIGNPLTEEEKCAAITDLANDYNSKHNLSGDVLNASKIGRQLLGVISLADFEDRKKLINKDNMMIGERREILKRLKRERRKLSKLATKESLIGASWPNFKEL